MDPAISPPLFLRVVAGSSLVFAYPVVLPPYLKASRCVVPARGGCVSGICGGLGGGGFCGKSGSGFEPAGVRGRSFPEDYKIVRFVSGILKFFCCGRGSLAAMRGG